jgi:hypothetical protein
MQRKRQFQTAQPRRTFFDRKVLKLGYGRTVSLGKAIPKDWTYARITILEKDKSHVVLDITKLLGVEPVALTQKSSPYHRQDA